MFVDSFLNIIHRYIYIIIHLYSYVYIYIYGPLHGTCNHSPNGPQKVSQKIKVENAKSFIFPRWWHGGEFSGVGSGEGRRVGVFQR